MTSLELNDIQGLIFSGYSEHEHAAFLLLSVDQPAGARGWLRGLTGRLTTGTDRSGNVRLNVAFTSAGLAKLGLGDDALASFPSEFVEGMSGSPKRSEILGDNGANHPDTWIWGSQVSLPVHVLLMIYAKSDGELNDALRREREELGTALREVYRRTTEWLAGSKEHFGFADGIAQPEILELGKPPKPGVARLRAGEFILGHANEYGKLPFSPEVPKELDPSGTLPARPGSDKKDLGHNGTFIVVRQLDQDVARFWDYMRGQAGGDQSGAVRFAAKCVGRWPGGAPLVLSPDRDDPALGERNDFSYERLDPKGLRCPIGSHIRRTNPRDSLDPTEAESLEVANRHALIRRGRNYGRPLAPFSPDDGKERGLFFVCVNANISRQFEFIQQTWINNPKFDGLAEDRDPLLANPGNASGIFTIPDRPLRQRLTGLPRFVTMRGGGYFFLPSIRALRFLAALRADGRSAESADRSAIAT
jgi:Dyp-type peroxidase family